MLIEFYLCGVFLFGWIWLKICIFLVWGVLIVVWFFYGGVCYRLDCCFVCVFDIYFYIGREYNNWKELGYCGEYISIVDVDWKWLEFFLRSI